MTTMATPVVSSYPLAHEIYDRDIRSRISERDRIKNLVIELRSGDWEVDTDEDAAQERLEARHSNGRYYLMRADGGSTGSIEFVDGGEVVVPPF